MDVMYWTFPDRSGKWSVHAAKPGVLEEGTGLNKRCMLVDWVDGVPRSANDGTLGTRWRDGLAVQQGEEPKDVWNTQVGGDHYRKMKIQPFQFSMANELDPMQHTIVKYVTRFRAKNGIEDLEKAKQTIDLLIQWEKDNALQTSANRR